MSKQLMLALGAGGTAVAAVVASAASLGSVNSTNLGAGTTVIASCDSDGIDVSYDTTFVAGKYRVSSISLDGVAAACDGQNVKVTLYDTGNTALGEATGVMGALGSGDFTVTGTPATNPDSNVVTGVAVVISG